MFVYLSFSCSYLPLPSLTSSFLSPTHIYPIIYIKATVVVSVCDKVVCLSVIRLSVLHNPVIDSMAEPAIKGRGGGGTGRENKGTCPVCQNKK